jgi:hypothetical protein
MSDIEKAAQVLLRVSNFLRSLTEEQIDDLMTGRVSLTLTSQPAKRRQRKRLSVTEIERVRTELQTRSSREAGIEYLDNLSLTKETLREIASALDLPTPRDDTIARLKDRIVEATIGYRLRSDAIRSRDEN